ncbi:E3 ubiquitin-protein ligase RNF180-like [Hyposmocoma kahamanoa]|uniref:E3 ubiquitin-protein ligase RNF180-like n=1 Tax=Hyposmocoma kahamanoa TaxID=1477025 RepID=UPI000E6D8B58|nr:E3 ubiquitin-protein ligase RNF180-like [Hyposmocoma kahamanoa]
MESQAKGAIKCHKCRHILFEDISNIYVNVAKDKAQCCSSYNINNFIYLLDERVPEWILKKIADESWTKGKLHCEKCGNKVGSFDYTSGRKYADFKKKKAELWGKVAVTFNSSPQVQHVQVKVLLEMMTLSPENQKNGEGLP